MTVAGIIASSGLSEINATTAKNPPITAVTLEQRPSIPSVRLTEFHSLDISERYYALLSSLKNVKSIIHTIAANTVYTL